MKYIFPALLISILFTSCGNHHPKEVQTIDSLITVIDSTRQVLNLLDTGKCNAYIKDGNLLLKKVHSLTETLNKEDAVMLDNFAALHKAFRKARSKFPRMYHDIEIIPQQLEDLKHDLSRDLIQEEQVKFDMTQESNATTALFEVVNQTYYGLNSIEAEYLKRKENVLHLIERLEAENQTEH